MYLGRRMLKTSPKQRDHILSVVYRERRILTRDCQDAIDAISRVRAVRRLVTETENMPEMLGKLDFPDRLMRESSLVFKFMWTSHSSMYNTVLLNMEVLTHLSSASG
jgi:hypothetical protein